VICGGNCTTIAISEELGKVAVILNVIVLAVDCVMLFF
jgi:hypothetical protein